MPGGECGKARRSASFRIESSPSLALYTIRMPSLIDRGLDGPCMALPIPDQPRTIVSQVTHEVS